MLGAVEMNERKTLLTEEEMDRLLVERHGEDIHRKLKEAHVAVAGLGGLGSNVAVMLARAGVGSLHLVDFDRVEGSNLNRQVYKMKHLGMYKTGALCQEIREINPYIELKADTICVTEQNAAGIFSGDRLICEAFDRAENKSMLVNAVMEQLPEAVLVSGSGMAGYASSNLIRTKKRMRRLYVCGDGVNGIDEGEPLMAPRVTVCAGHQANMILRLILGVEAV